MNFENERVILSAQDEGLITNGVKKIFKFTTNDKSGICQASVETVNHLLSGCPSLLAEAMYTTSYYNGCRGIPHCKKKSVRESETVRQPSSRQVFFSSNSETDLSLFKFLNVNTRSNYKLQMIVCCFLFSSIYINIAIVQRCIRLEILKEMNPFLNW